MLNATFGWSRHYGRHGWERQQFAWLHKVVARDVKPDPAAAAFIQKPRPAQPAPVVQKPDRFFAFLRRIYMRPHELLIGYFGFRVVQFVVRLMV